jgi:dipeptidyl-peptidase 4
MKKIIIALFAFACVLSVQAQQILSLEEAVLGQFRQFYPEQINQLNWLPETDTYVFVRNDSLIIGTIKGKELKSITRDELSTLIAPVNALKSFPGLNWINTTQCYFIHENQYLKIDLKSRSVLSRIASPAQSENADFHGASANLAFTRDNNVFVLAGGKETQITSNPAGVVSGQSIARNEYGISKGTFWNNAGTSLAFYEKDERNVTEYPLTDYTTQPATVRNIRYPMSGQSGEIPAVGVFNTTTGKTIYLDLFGTERKGDGYYVTNLTWSPDDKSIFVIWLNRATTKVWLKQYDAATGKEIRTVLTEEDDRWIEPLQPISFIPGNNDLFLWHSWKEGFHNYYLYTMTGKFVSKTTAKFELDEIIGFDDKGKTMFVSGRGQNPTEQHTYAVSIPDMTFTRVTPAEGTHNVKVSKSGYLLDTYSSLTVANRVELSKGGKIIRTLLNAQDKMTSYRAGQTEIVTLDANDGTTLYARVIKPSDFSPTKQYPVVVYVYNGPHVQLVTNSWLGGASLWMNYLAEMGYIVFTLDGRGSAHRGKEFEQAIHRRLGTLEIEDQLTGVKWLQSQPWVDRGRMGIHGWSYGGFMTTSLMLRTPGTFKAGVAGGPVIDWSLYEVMYTERYMDTPDENQEGYKTADPTGYVDRLQGKLLMIHGTDDDVVVMQHNMKFLKACIGKNVQVDFFAYPGHAHNVRGKDRVHLMQKVIDYLQRHI